MYWHDRSEALNRGLEEGYLISITKAHASITVDVVFAHEVPTKGGRPSTWMHPAAMMRMWLPSASSFLCALCVSLLRSQCLF